MSFHYSMLASVTLFQGLDLHELQALMDAIQTREYAAGENLFVEGDPGGMLMIVVSGAVEIFIYGENNTSITLNTINVGGFFGEVSLFDGSQRSTNAVARQPTTVATLSRDVMVDYLHKHPSAAINIITVLSKRLRDATTLIGRRETNAYEVLQEKLKRSTSTRSLPVER